MSETRTVPGFTPEEQELLRQAVEVIRSVAQQHGVEVVQIYLFGSRARGEATTESDWDFYVVVDKEISFPQRQRIASRIRRHLAKQNMICDVFIQGQQTVRRRQRDTGYLTFYALQQGVPVHELGHG